MGHAKILEKLVNPCTSLNSPVYCRSPMFGKLSRLFSTINPSCCRWEGAAPKAAEVNAEPSVATADKAVNNAMKSQQQEPDNSTHSTNRTSEVAATSQQPSNKDADGLHGLQQRPRGQNQKSSLSS